MVDPVRYVRRCGPRFHLRLRIWRCRRWLGDVLDLSRTIVEEFANPPVRQNVSCRGGVLYGHIADFRREFDADSTEFAWLHVVQGTRFLITGRVKAVQSAERARQFIDHGGNFASPDAMFSWLLASYADNLDAALHRLTDELELIEDHVLDDRHRGERRRLMPTRRVEIRKLHQKLGTTTLFVTHDQVEAMTLADRIVVMNKGTVEQVGTPAEVYGRPRSTYVASFIGTPGLNLLRGTAEPTEGIVRLADGQCLAYDRAR